jgi:hypothetical protein
MSKRLRLLIVAVIGICAAPGCSSQQRVTPSGSTSGQAATREQTTLPAVSGNIGSSTAWISDYLANQVYECQGSAARELRPAPLPTGRFFCRTFGQAGEFNWDGPQGLTFAFYDRNVYVADTNNQRIVVLGHKKGNLVRTLRDPNEYPVDVAVANDGTVAVTNNSGDPSHAGNIGFYAPGSISPTSIATGLLTTFLFGGFDKKGDFYNDGYTAGGAVAVGVVKKGTTTDVDTGFGASVSSPGGVEVAKDGSVDVVDRQCPCLKVFTTHSSGTVPFEGASAPEGFALSAHDEQVWTADAGLAAVEVYAYPQGGAPIATITGFEEPAGVALARRGTQ